LIIWLLQVAVAVALMLVAVVAQVDSVLAQH
jgi:hypothetical protein